MDGRPGHCATVMFLCPTLRIGGAERALEAALRHPHRLGFRPIVCCTYGPGELGRALIEHGITVHHSLATNRLDLRLLYRLVGLLRRERARVLYDVMGDANTLFYGFLAARLVGGVSTVSAVHHARPSTGRGALVRRALMRRYERVVVLSEQHRGFVKQQYGVAEERMRVVPNGIDLDGFSEIAATPHDRGQLGLPADGPIVAMVATLRPLKAHNVLLRAVPAVLATVPNAHFILVGDGPERVNLEREVQRMMLASRVHFLGSRADVPAILSHVDVSVLSSNHEALSISILEAMAASKPVVATKVGLMAEMVVDGETGFLVERGDADGLAAAIVRLLLDPSLSAKIGQAGRRRIEERFSVDKTIAAIEAVIAEVQTVAGPVAGNSLSAADHPGYQSR